MDFFYAVNKTFFIVVDAFSRWVEVIPMNSTNAQQVILALANIFSRFGDPITVVSDNGPPFSSSEFKQFCDDSDISLMHSPPYHPQSNGIAERWVQTVKVALKKELGTAFNEKVLLKILFSLRNTPTSEGNIPSELVFSFTPRTELEKVVQENPCHKSSDDDEQSLPAYRSFSIGDKVFLKGEKSVSPGIVLRKIGQVLYEVAVDSGGQRVAHANQLKLRNDNNQTLNPNTDLPRRSSRISKPPLRLNL